jgi:hypothetical protein
MGFSDQEIFQGLPSGFGQEPRFRAWHGMEDLYYRTLKKKIMVLRGNHTWDPKILNDHIEELLAITRKYDATFINRKLQELILNYTTQF